MSAPHITDEEAVAAADKEMEERANRAKELLSQRYVGLKRQQVSFRSAGTLPKACKGVFCRKLSLRFLSFWFYFSFMPLLFGCLSCLHLGYF